jgi:hypothetical protein
MNNECTNICVHDAEGCRSGEVLERSGARIGEESGDDSEPRFGTTKMTCKSKGIK